MSSKTIHICDICHRQLKHPTKRGKIEMRRHQQHGTRFSGDICPACEAEIDNVIRQLSEQRESYHLVTRGDRLVWIVQAAPRG